MEEPDSQPCGPTVLDDPGPFHSDDDSPELLPSLPVEESAQKKQKVEEPVAKTTRMLDQIKWVGTVPFVLCHATQKIHCGHSVMCKSRMGGLTVIHCLTNCCTLGGHSDGEKCGCFCHLLAKSYQHEWPPTSIEG